MKTETKYMIGGGVLVAILALWALMPSKAKAAQKAAGGARATKDPIKVRIAEDGDDVGLRVYTVQPGDTLSNIGDYFGVPWRNIYVLNQQVIGKNPDLILPGQRLQIPPPSGGGK